MLDPARDSGDFVSPADPDEHIFADVLLGGKLVRMVLVWRATLLMSSSWSAPVAASPWRFLLVLRWIWGWRLR